MNGTHPSNNMNRQEMYSRLLEVEKLAKTSKIKRMMHAPLKYIFAIGWRSTIYRLNQTKYTVNTSLFTGQKISLWLPAATDIYLTGGKSHPSETRLAKFMILNIEEGQTYWDIGAHYGYFSMIASLLTSSKGHVLSVEASPVTFNLLKENTQNLDNSTIINSAVSDKLGEVSFYQFPNLYSEYNSVDVEQFNHESWYQGVKASQVMIKSITLDNLYKENSFSRPDMIKIDVEGAEFRVISGGSQLFTESSPIVIMEYLAGFRGNKPHHQATQKLIDLGYQPHIIQEDGNLLKRNDIDAYLDSENLESDNIVFLKNGI